MTDIPEPTLELLSRLLGKRLAKQLYRGSLTDLFLGEDTPAVAKLQLQTSRERAGPALAIGGPAP